MGKKPKSINIWNQYDEWGVLAGLSQWSDDEKTLRYVRYPNETNKLLRQRIKDSMEHRGDGSIQGMINNISRDLGISVSGSNLLPWYNSKTRSIYYLSEEPYPSPTGIVVYVSTSGTWTNTNQVLPQVRASGYADAVSGWILWNLPDLDPSNIDNYLPGSSGWYEKEGIEGMYNPRINYGKYTRILEFIGDSIPDTDSKIRVDYLVQTETDDYGKPVVNWRSDFSHPDMDWDDRFIGSKSALPTDIVNYNNFVSGHVSIYNTSDLQNNTAVSGYFYDSNGKPTDKLLKLHKIIDDANPMRWGKFRFDIGRWDQLERSSVGSVPSFHDENLPNSGVTHYNGSRYGIDLDMVGIEVTASGARDYWYPKFEPGEFYINNKRYYMFSKMQHEIVNFTKLWDGPYYSGHLNASGVNIPGEMEMITGMTSGKYFDDPNLPDNPYIKQIYEFGNPPISIKYRTPNINFSVRIQPSGIDFDNGQAFYYDYDNNDVFVSGVSNTDLVLVWEHQDVATSGIFITFSGGWGFETPNLNPIVDPNSKIYYITDA